MFSGSVQLDDRILVIFSLSAFVATPSLWTECLCPPKVQMSKS